MKEAAGNHDKFSNALFEAGLEDETPEGAETRARVGRRIQTVKLPEFYTLGTILGDCYSDSPVVQKTPVAALPPRDFLNYVPSALPGCRAPHAWLHDGSSLFDHFGQGLTLLSQPSAASACLDAARRDAQALRIPLTTLAADNPAVTVLYPRKLTLIRPDQHIAWAGDTWPERGDFDVLAMATGQTAEVGASTPGSTSTTTAIAQEPCHAANA